MGAANCNHDAADACEANLSSIQTCGSCSKQCDLGATCGFGNCQCLTQKTTTATTGDMGGNAFPDECPAGQVMIGFETGYSQGFYGGTFAMFATQCGSLVKESTGPGTWTIKVVSGARIPATGGRGPSANTAVESTSCPADQVVVGVDGEGSRPLKMRLHCAPLTANGEGTCLQIVQGAVTNMPYLGLSTGTAFGPLNCPADTVASGSNMRAGEVMNMYGLFCKSVNLALNGQ